ncbi:MAG TPA: LysR family transcriptional regulator [Capillimicrobium sp.]
MPDRFAEPLSGRDLAAFVAAVESGSVQGAAEALDLTQSAATKRIRALEARTGSTLLERGRFGVRPTDAGRLLYPEARQALAALARAEATLAGERDRTPVLRLAASHTIGEFLLPGWLAGFRAAGEAGGTDARAQVEVTNSAGVLAEVRQGDVEVGFVEGLDRLDGLDSLELLRDEIVCVVAPGHRWARRRAVPAAALPSEPFLTREAGSGTRAVALAALGDAGVELAPSLEAASSQSLKRAVLDGGFTLMSRLVVAAEAQAGTLIALPVAGADLSRDLRAVRRRRPALPPPARRLWDWLAAARFTPP